MTDRPKTKRQGKNVNEECVCLCASVCVCVIVRQSQLLTCREPRTGLWTRLQKPFHTGFDPLWKETKKTKYGYSTNASWQ